MDGDYHLFTQAFGHTGDVRDVVGLTQDSFASCSRDGSIRIWKLLENSYETTKTLTGHTNPTKMGISTLLYIKPGTHPILKQGALVSGAYDKCILVWDIDAITGDATEPMLTLLGQQEAPTCLSFSHEGNILSGAADNIGRVWQGSTCIQELRGHQFPIWAIIGLGNGDIVTGSGDRTIKIWREGRCIKTITDHTDAVRALADVPGLGFLSASNDCTLRLWTYDGNPLQIMHGHAGFIYQLIALPNGSFASASEDGTVKIWRDGQCVQTLDHPRGIWSVSLLENGDIVSGSQDGIIRVWSQDPNRKANDELLASYQKDVLESRSRSTVGDLDLNKLPGPEALNNKGTYDGQNLMINDHGKGFMYAWNVSSDKWDLIGEISDAKDPDKSDKKMLDGVGYDYVWDVELGDGGPMRQIGYNTGENPYMVAQEFIMRHELDQNFLDEIAKFIAKNAPQVATTGGTGMAPRSNPGSTAPTPSVPRSNSKFFPQLKPLLFEATKPAQFDGWFGKVKQFSTQLASESAALALNEKELSLLETVCGKLKQTSRYHATTISADEHAVSAKLLDWPAKYIWPVLDYFRLLVLHPEAAKHIFTSGVLPKVITAGTKKDGDDKSNALNSMLLFKFIANCFMFDSLRSKMPNFEEQILDSVSDAIEGANKNTLIAVASVLLNFSVLYLIIPSDKGIPQTLSIIEQALQHKEADGEIQLRLLVALGSIIYSRRELQQLAKDLGLLELVNGLVESAVGNVKLCAHDITALYPKN